MKRKIVILGALLALFSVSYGQNTHKALIEVSLSKEKFDGVKNQYIYVKTDNPDESASKLLVLDSAKITNQTVKFAPIEINSNRLDRGYLFVGAKSRPIIFVIEGGKIKIDLTGKSTIRKGTALNDNLQVMEDSINTLITGVRERMKSLSDSINKIKDADKKQEFMMSIVQPVTEKIGDILKNIFESHKNDALGLEAILRLQSYEDDVDVQSKQIASAGKLLKDNILIKDILKYIKNLESTKPGKMFKDFSGVNDRGDSVKLSSYVGKGKYVLVDFWASWCGPCRHEIPNVIKVYNDYKDKGLEVVGVAVWDKMPDHLSAVKELNITYPQIFNEKEATTIYGIKGIPEIILFAPDGTIIKRGLRGEEMIQLVADKLGKKK